MMYFVLISVEQYLTVFCVFLCIVKDISELHTLSNVIFFDYLMIVGLISRRLFS